MKQVVVLLLCLLCISCHSISKINNTIPEQVIVLKVVKTVNGFNIIEIRELNGYTPHSMKTTSHVNVGDTILAKPDIDYHYYHWY